MKSTLMMIATAAGTCAFASAPEVTVNSTVQDRSRAVKVTYTIAGEPAVVTPYAETNRGDGVWIDIGSGNVSFCTGDINKLVDVGDHEFTWQADKSWPNHKIAEGKIRVGVKAWATNAPPDYMVVDLDSPSNACFYASKEALPGGIQDKAYKTRKILMRKIPAAGVTWRMGQPSEERGGLSGCLNGTVNVEFSQDYYAGVFKLTAYQYWKACGTKEPGDNGTGGREIGSLNEWGEPNDETPARGMSWLVMRCKHNKDFSLSWPRDGHKVDADSVLGKLRAKTGIEFDLPTEAQWEYAMRAGEADACYLGGLYTNEKANLIAWHNGNRTKKIDGVDSVCLTHRVGQLLPNAWDLYDTVGNGREWCLDYYTTNLSHIGGKDPTGPTVEQAGQYSSKYYRVNRTSSSVKPWAEQTGLTRSENAQNIQDSTFSCRLVCPAVISINP